MNEGGALVELYWQGIRKHTEKPVPGPFYPPEIPHGLTKDWNRGLHGNMPSNCQIHDAALHQQRPPLLM